MSSRRKPTKYERVRVDFAIEFKDAHSSVLFGGPEDFGLLESVGDLRARHAEAGRRGEGRPMTSAPVTVVDHIPYSASVSPEQAAAYCRRHPRLAGWSEVTHSHDCVPFMVRFTEPGKVAPTARQVEVPARVLRDYSRRMAELCSALVALGCAERPSEILKGMGEERL